MPKDDTPTPGTTHQSRGSLLWTGFLAVLAAGVITLGVVQCTAARASSGDCGLIRDPDLRRMCFSRSERSSSDCGLIRDRDLQRMCYARHGRRRGQ